MKTEEIIFNEDSEVYVSLKGFDRKIRLVLSDALYASDEELTTDYQSKIAYFLNNNSNWYSLAIESIRNRAKKKYYVEVKDIEINLMTIFVLFEQNEDELFGLGFNTEFDKEHGCGVKIKVINNLYTIVETGTWDVAFA